MAVAKSEPELKHGWTLQALRVRRRSTHTDSLYLKFKTQPRSAFTKGSIHDGDTRKKGR